MTDLVYSKCDDVFSARLPDHWHKCGDCTTLESEEAWRNKMALYALTGKQPILVMCPQTCIQCRMPAS